MLEDLLLFLEQSILYYMSVIVVGSAVVVIAYCCCRGVGEEPPPLRLTLDQHYRMILAEAAAEQATSSACDPAQLLGDVPSKGTGLQSSVLRSEDLVDRGSTNC